MLDPARAQRYRRHDLIDWFSQEQVAAARVAVIGAGAVGNEVVKNLALLGCGAIDVFDFDTVELHNLTRSILLREADAGRNKAAAVVEHARDIDPNVALRAVPGDFWDELTLGQLGDYDCAIAAVDNFEARLKLNQMCLLARVDLVNAGLDSRWAVVESFPFGSVPQSACYECTLPESAYTRIAERYSCGGLRRRAALERRIPTTAITASIAGALAAATALRLGGQPPSLARRRLFDTISGCGSAVDIGRRTDCPGCGEFDVPPRVVRIRNRWVAGHEVARTALPAVASQSLQLSDALITGYECAACGPLAEAAQYLNRRAAAFDDSIACCPRCAAPAVRVEIRDTFTVAELAERCGTAGVPAKFALARFDAGTVCFDLEELPRP
jgi:molybdopterin/thiamine biosynthesis adenylyltransferase